MVSLSKAPQILHFQLIYGLQIGFLKTYYSRFNQLTIPFVKYEPRLILERNLNTDGHV